MKYTITLILFILSTHCYSQNSKVLIGKWQFKELSSQVKPDSIGQLFLEKTLKHFYIYLKPNGKYLMNMIQKEEGTWSINESDYRLTLFANKGTISSNRVKIINENAIEYYVKSNDKDFLILEKTQPTQEDSVEKPITIYKLKTATAEELCKIWYLKSRENPETKKEVLNVTNKLISNSVTFEFTKDNVFKSQMEQLKGESQWEFNSDKSEIIIKEKDYSKFWKILKLDDDELILIRGNTDETWNFKTTK